MPQITVRLDSKGKLEVSHQTIKPNGKADIEWTHAPAASKKLDWFVIAGLTTPEFSNVKGLIVSGTKTSVKTTDANKKWGEHKYWVIGGKGTKIMVLDPRIRNDGSGGP